MKKLSNWYYDEPAHAGVNYSSEEVVADYDEHHTKFRNYGDEADRIIQDLNLGKEDMIIDMGCGSGELAINLARHCKKVCAVDISPKMIDLCKRKIEQNHIDNVLTVCAGFLSYEHSGELVDAAVSNVVLHHLPDFWKQIALNNIYHLLKHGGKFFLFDVVFFYR